MKILVTGGAGYIGSVCTELLVARGHEVLVLDNLSEGHRAAVPSPCSFAHCDLLDRDGVARAFQRFTPEAVMHLAAEAEVEKSVHHPSVFFQTNVAGGIQILDAMVQHGVKKIVFSSTAAVYGEPRKIPIAEDHPKSPVNPYGQTKLLFETILSDYARYCGIQYVSLRYFNAAGASEERGEAHRTETHLIARVLEVAAGQRDKLDICGSDYPTPDGTCIRDFIHVLDIAEAHLLAINAFGSTRCDVFNVGSSNGHSILDLLGAARRITGKPIRAEFAPRRPGDPARLVASPAKIETVLGWKARHSTLETIIESAWLWKKRFPNGYLNGTVQPAKPLSAGGVAQSSM